MPYLIIKRKILARPKEETEGLNRLADKYKSFRVISMTEHEYLVWFDTKELLQYETNVSQVQ